MTQKREIQEQDLPEDGFIQYLIQRHKRDSIPALERLWDYYRNEAQTGTDGAPRLAQAAGLPDRLANPPGDNRREVVIENDIAWRIQTGVDFMFGKMPTLESLAPDRDRAQLISAALGAAFDANGSITFFQNLALLGAIYGFVDVLVRPPSLPLGEMPAQWAERADPTNTECATRAASQITLETVEAPRAIPLLDGSDYRKLDAYLLHYTRPINRLEHSSVLARLVRNRARPSSVEVTEIHTPHSTRLWHDGEEVARIENPLGLIPVVHIQNIPQPFFYEGLSDVEPLIPLQDELNTRLSDRANRVTLQSFRMYLARGIEGFTQRPVGPGQVWLTDNPEASIESFGGDGGPHFSEESHINEIREAMDKTSGVSALAAGVLRNKVGNLTSENALRVTLMGLLARTERKRVSYGRGIERVCELILAQLDHAGVLHTTAEERRVCLHWPSPLPENSEQRLREAQLKLSIGIPRDRVLTELGYCDLTPDP